MEVKVIFFVVFSLLNFLSQVLPIYLLSISAEADTLVVVLSICTAITGVAISTTNSLFLNVKNDENTEVNLFYVVLILIIVNILSAVLYIVADYFFPPVAGELDAFPIYALLCLVYTTALFGFLGGVFQRLGLLDRFYLFGALGTLASIYLIVSSPYEINAFVRCYIAKFSAISLCAMLYLWTRKKTIGISFIFEIVSIENIKNAISILVSGVLAKGAAPFERTLLAMISDGWASMLHIASAVFMTVGKYIDSNFIYKAYIKKDLNFERIFILNQTYTRRLLVGWLTVGTIVAFSHEYAAVEVNFIGFIISAVVVIFFLLPNFYSVVMNTVLNQVEFERGNHFYIAKITVCVAVLGYVIKLVASMVESTGLLLLFLGVPPMMYVLLISSQSHRLNFQNTSSHE